MTFPLRIEAPAKINLFLDVLERREDGFHNLRSLMQTIDLVDHIELNPGGEGIVLGCSDPALPTDESNLVVRAIKLLIEEAGIGADWRVKLEKNIPTGAGLGGGSADAGAILCALISHLGIEVEREQILQWAMRLGSDVPFSYVGGTALVEGKGERVVPCPTSGETFNYVLVSPTFSCATAGLYARLAPYSGRNHPSIQPLLIAMREGDVDAIGVTMFNTFETVVFQDYPQLGELRDNLLKWGAVGAVMTGSGSNVIALTSDHNQAKKLTLRCIEQGWNAAVHSSLPPSS
jgi:4-diphosphocytidyl-2-C-methyl-D-erythritol kinase